MDDTGIAINALAEGLATLAEAGSVILDAVDGYRAECLRRGYSETAAECMAIEHHKALMNTVWGGSK